MPKQIELLLTENVDNLGIVGDVVKVKTGYARNYLLPRGFATTPSEEAIAALQERRRQVEAELAKQRKQLEDLFARLDDDFELTIERSANEQGVLFGGVSQHDISEALQAQGHDVDDRAVRIGEQIKRLDSYTIPIVLAPDLKTEIKLWVVSDQPIAELDEEGEADTAEAETDAEVEAVLDPEAAAVEEVEKPSPIQPS